MFIMAIAETKSSLRVISMVPSWTETLLECGINVVGRTRFCIHPDSCKAQIPVVGGTKDIQWDKVRALKPDILLLDKEENLAVMAEGSPCKVVVTHVEGLSSMPAQLAALAEHFTEQGQALLSLKKRFEKVLQNPHRPWTSLPEKMPAQIDDLKRDLSNYEKIVYVIWRDPWMSISPQTYIGSVLQHLGAQNFLLENQSMYPQINLEKFDFEKTYFLFSSEPFPFLKKKEDLKALNVQGCIVDGESYSWFGIRSLKFLEACLKTVGPL